MEKTEVIKILIKDHFEKKGDLVSRPLVRAYNKIDNDGIKRFIGENGIYLYAYKKGNQIYELFTGLLIDIDNINYDIVDSKEMSDKVNTLSKDEIMMIYLLVRKFVFGDNIDINFVEVSTMQELADDRAMQFLNYNAGLSDINPYDKDCPNAYNLSLVERSKKLKF